jgi:hypothetical protein
MSIASYAINDIDEGIKVNYNDDLENACDSIPVKHENDSNVSNASDLQYQKHFDSRI